MATISSFYCVCVCFLKMRWGKAAILNQKQKIQSLKSKGSSEVGRAWDDSEEEFCVLVNS